MDKFFFPQKGQLHKTLVSIDKDTALILLLVMIIIKEKGDTLLILALLYILT